MEESYQEPSKIQKNIRAKNFWLGIFAVAIIIILISLHALNTPPKQFPINQPVVVEPGLSAAESAAVLKSTGVIRSESLLYSLLLLLHDPSEVKAGTYVFLKPESTAQIAERITGEAPPEEFLPITFPEGFTVREFGRIAAQTLEQFDQSAFWQLASSSEGQLFPETYYVPLDYSAADIFDLLSNMHQERTKHITGNALSREQIIVLASLLEREANTAESMQLVAGILLNRLAIDMPLQVDASMEYILDRPLNQLAPGELAQNIREIDSPYNTYLNRGLPPTPIGNPGQTAIDAVLNPTQSNYLFYITGTDGNFYYARTFEEHKQNITRYLQ